MLLRVQKGTLVPSSNTPGIVPSLAFFRSFDGDVSEVDRYHGLQTLKTRLQQHTLLLPIQADRTPDMQVPISFRY